MKSNILVLITFLLCSFAYSQQDTVPSEFLNFSNETTEVDTCFSVSEIIDIGKKIKSLQQKNSEYDKEIQLLKLQKREFVDLNKHNESILKLKNKELEIYKSVINRFTELPEPPKEAFFQSRTFSFLSGVIIGGGTVWLGAVIVSKVR